MPLRLEGWTSHTICTHPGAFCHFYAGLQRFHRRHAEPVFWADRATGWSGRCSETLPDLIFLRLSPASYQASAYPRRGTAGAFAKGGDKGMGVRESPRNTSSDRDDPRAPVYPSAWTCWERIPCAVSGDGGTWARPPYPWRPAPTCPLSCCTSGPGPTDLSVVVQQPENPEGAPLCEGAS